MNFGRACFCLATLLASGGVLSGTALETFVAAYDEPQFEAAALSPDGRHLACIEQTSAGAFAVVMDVEAATVVARLQLNHDRGGRVPGTRISWLNPRRFLVQIGLREIVALEADGRHVTAIVDWKAREWYRVPTVPTLQPPYDSPVSILSAPRTLTPGFGPGIARRVRVVAVPAAEPDFVYVEGAIYSGVVGVADVVVARVHSVTGKIEVMRDFDAGGPVIYDPQGRPRLQHSTRENPHRYLYRPESETRNKWQPLEQILAHPDAGSLAVAPATFFGQRTLPIAMDYDANILWIASNVGRDTFGIYGVDLRTGRRTGQSIEHPAFDLIHVTPYGVEADLVFDAKRQALAGVRYQGLKSAAVWLDEDLTTVQRRLEARMPSSSVQIENWDDTRTRFLVRLSTRTEPGSYALFDRATDKLKIYLPRRPNSPSLQPTVSVPWALKRETGETITGVMSVRPDLQAKPLALVVCFRSMEWARPSTEFSPEVAALAQMGFAVLEVNHRGLPGLGWKHWTAGRLAADRVAADDVFFVIDRLANDGRYATKRVALFGSQFGGYLALRVAQLRPDRIACVAVNNPTFDLDEWVDAPVRGSLAHAARSWFFGQDRPERRAASPLHQAGTLTRPLLYVSGRGSATRDALVDNFRARLKAAGNEPQFYPLAAPDDRGVARRYAPAFMAVESFFSKHLSAESR